MHTSIDIGGHAELFELDFDSDTWHSGHTFDEAAFPLIAELEGRRYELYSDGTFAEEELT